MANDGSLPETTMSAGGDHLWRWANAAYGLDGVSPRLLALQDRHHKIVMVVLWCLWAARAGYVLKQDDVVAITAPADKIDRYGVEPIRAARRYLSASPTVLNPETRLLLKKDILAAELSAERAIANVLEHETWQRSGPPPDASANATPNAEEDLAKTYFTNLAPRLEKPLVLVDDGASDGPLDLFSEISSLTRYVPL